MKLAGNWALFEGRIEIGGLGEELGKLFLGRLIYSWNEIIED